MNMEIVLERESKIIHLGTRGNAVFVPWDIMWSPRGTYPFYVSWKTMMI